MKQLPITFLQFKDAVDSLTAHHEESQSFDKALSPFFDGWLNCNMGNGISGGMIDLLESLIDRPDIISEFIYSWDSGKKPWKWSINGVEFIVDSAETLWEAIMINWLEGCTDEEHEEWEQSDNHASIWVEGEKAYLDMKFNGIKAECPYTGGSKMEWSWRQGYSANGN